VCVSRGSDVQLFVRAFASGDTAERRPFDRLEAFPEIDGTSWPIRQLKRHMWCVARDRDVTVLLTGESGTGKERIARAIHRASPRAAAPFVVVDCAGMSATLAEDTLFGHVRGAFTGAIESRPGPFERAAGGTILLDEIGDLPLDLQMKLLRALQSRTVQRLGASQETAFDVRIIAATNVNLGVARARGRFRDDLFYRLRVYEIAVPSLRRRGATDVRVLIAAVVQRLAERRGIAPPAIDAAALQRLLAYTWPGNVRELEHTIERMLVSAAGDGLLSTWHLPDHLRGGADPASAPRPIALTTERVQAALAEHAFKQGRAAVALGLSRHQLYRLVKRHGLGRGDSRR
jgi:Nif-specific regulatory protein